MTIDDTSPEDTDAGRFLMNAMQFLMMAKLVVDTDEFRQHPLRYNRPILNTLGVGVEVFLKSILLSDGKDIKSVIAYGHRLGRLWDDCPSEIREIVFEEAERTHDRFLGEGLPIGHRGANFRDDFVASLHNLSDRYSLDGSQLRYTAPAGTLATRPGLLVYTFEAAARRRFDLAFR